MKIRATQTGGLVLYALIAAIVFIVIMHFTNRENSSLLPVLVVLPILIVTLLFFYRIVIEADEKEIRFSMGIGWLTKSYPMANIDSCTVVRNKWWYGWGIRYFPGGILYNVTGFQAIELKFKDRKSVVRLGTSRPEELCRFIEKRIKQ